ncbi:MAG: hypothetical protein M2R45_05315 [Verrucomicrobia subdivision 3 bacterium]|nr:hypothetical protein [Limisphaerales bacterium]MCS1415711.1 hypothetical protein [Limisphaerales bacterium]
MVCGSQRYTVWQHGVDGWHWLHAGVIGLFGVSEVLRNVCIRRILCGRPCQERKESRILRDSEDAVAHKPTVTKSSILGTVIGALPSAGADIAARAAYGVAQRTSRKGDIFGKGGPKGAWIPALVFGIPGDSATVIVLGALLMYDIKPGADVIQAKWFSSAEHLSDCAAHLVSCYCRLVIWASRRSARS